MVLESHSNEGEGGGGEQRVQFRDSGYKACCALPPTARGITVRFEVVGGSQVLSLS